MSNIYRDSFNNVISAKLPEYDSLDGYLSFILNRTAKYSNIIENRSFIVNKRWTEIRDDDNFHEVVLHIFKLNDDTSDEFKDQPFVKVIDGNVTNGEWSTIEGGNGLFVKHLKEHEFYDLRFINEDFLVLQKHGNQRQRTYLFLVNERIANNREWREIVEIFYDVYRFNPAFLILIIVVVLFLVGIYMISFA